MGAAAHAVATVAGSELARMRGYVEAIGATAIQGWAWSPIEPEARLTVVLRDGDAVLQSVLADRPRPDLARNGVGDGAHAFTLELDAGHAARAGELEVVAIAPDGSELVLAAPPPATGVADLRRALEGLAASQRVLHRNLQALLLASKAREPMDAALERIAEVQSALDARTAELEVFVSRLDARLAALAPEAAPASSARAGRVALAAAGALAVVGIAGVLARMAG